MFRFRHETGDLQNIIFGLKKTLSDNIFFVEVRRDFILEDALREICKKKFSPKKNIKVKQIKF